MSDSKILPDSRPKERRGAIPSPYGMMIPIYCANCGCDGGYVPEKYITHVFYVCDECWEKHGPPPGTMYSSDEAFYKKVVEEQLDSYGRQLTPEEMDKVEQANASPLAALIREGRRIQEG